jgi:peptidyl-prolyl cis-trans isomerase SDCCAG10
MAHELKFSAGDAVLAKDANTKSDDWYDVFDPRNPINKRRRKEDEKPKGKSRKS